MEQLDEIVQEFLVESYENLDQLDSDLVALERSPGDRDLLGSVFRTIHTIKGTSGFLAFGNLESLTHVGENLLVELRDGHRSMDRTTTDVLLEMVDGVRSILRAIEADGTEGGIDVSPTVTRIQTVLDDDAAPAGAETSTEQAETNTGDSAPKGTSKATSNGASKVTAKTAKNAAKSATTTTPKRTSAPARKPAAKRVIGRKPTAAPEREGGAGVDVVSEPAVLPSQRTGPVDTSPDQATEHASRTSADSSIRVDVDLLDALMRQVGELVLARNTISRLADDVADLDLVRASQRLSLIASELQEGVMKTRMQPIEYVWSKVPRMVRDLASTLDRQVRLEMVGGDTELDRSLLEAIKDPLTHLVRNAVDHGIEPPAVREAAHKPAQGTLTLRAFHAGGQVVVEVSDDGKGVDPERVAEIAVERGLRTAEQVEAMAPSEILQLLFLPGFSTADAVTNVSGRGVGTDVVRSRIEAIGGTVDIESRVGKGTTWRLRIPLTLAIMPALTVACDEQLYAIPQVSLLELVALGPSSPQQVEYVGTSAVYRLRGDLLPLVDLREVFGAPARPADAGTVIAVLHADGQRFGLVVDAVLNTEEIVVKPLAAQLKSIGLYAGATLLGDGRVSLILDVPAIARRTMGTEVGEAARSTRSDEAAATRSSAQLLVAGIGGGRRVAIPLSTVTRLEKLPAALLEHVGGREVVQYRGAITPVARLSRLLGSDAFDDTAFDDASGGELTVVVYTRGERSVAMVVDEIIDIVDDLRDHSDLGDDGLVGSTVLADRVTELLDVRSAVTAVDPSFFADELAGFDILKTVGV